MKFSEHDIQEMSYRLEFLEEKVDKLISKLNNTEYKIENNSLALSNMEDLYIKISEDYELLLETEEVKVKTYSVEDLI